MTDRLQNSTQPVGRRVGAARSTGLETLYLLVKFGFGGWIVRLTCSRLELSSVFCFLFLGKEFLFGGAF